MIIVPEPRRETPFERRRYLRHVPPLEGDLSTRRHWIIVREPGCTPEKKGSFKHDQVDGFVRELVDCRPPGTDITIVSLTWDFDVWVDDGRRKLAIQAALDAPGDDWPPEPVA